MKQKTKKSINNITIGSMLIGALTFGLLGFSIFNLLTRLDIINSIALPATLFIIVGGLLGVLAGIKYPLSVESFSFAFTALITVQAVWDATYDISDGIHAQRVMIGLIALSIFVINIFTGKLKRGTAKNQIRRTLGVSKIK